jgi:hypothetical protein
MTYTSVKTLQSENCNTSVVNTMKTIYQVTGVIAVLLFIGGGIGLTMQMGVKQVQQSSWL